MKNLINQPVFTFLWIVLSSIGLHGQVLIKGSIIDQGTGDPLIGANVEILSTSAGTTTDFDGSFELITDGGLPVTLITSYLGYDEMQTVVTDVTAPIVIKMTENSVTVNVVEVKASRISEDTKKSALTIESLDMLAIKETPSSNFYEGLGSLKNVDLTTASLGFQVINTRGFNSTSPVRSLQIIDGVDNQAPGLNFSLGNFLGSSELDVRNVDLIVGASSAFYGPNAFNGVIKMETRNPFLQQGLSASVKVGERNLLETAVRYADAFTNNDGHEWFAYKVNLSYMVADDWEAENYDPITGSIVDTDNPGGYDAVNIYGDEYIPAFDIRDVPLFDDLAGIGVHYRQGYRELDVVDYDTDNFKSNAALHFRLRPSMEYESPELIMSGNYSTGSTVYQGDNRFRLENIQFFQGRVELRKRDKYFLRAYMTNENAGDSYDPYFTALLLQQAAKSNVEYNTAFTNYWIEQVAPDMRANEYPESSIVTIPEPPFFEFRFDNEAAEQWLLDNQDLIDGYHRDAAAASNMGTGNNFDFFVPGSEAFNAQFDRITSTPSGDEAGGTKIIDRSSLYHIHGEYQFEVEGLNYLRVGANGRLYAPISEGTIFDDADEPIRNSEYGVYAGAERSFIDDKLALSATLRLDKNQNFDHLVSPAASLVYQPDDRNFARLSFSSAIRNPTLSDQYLDFNVGRAILAGNLNGQDSLITLESFDDFRNGVGTVGGGLDRDRLVYFDINPIRPEQVRTIEAGYRTTLFDNTFVDASYYFSSYTDFIGFNIGLRADFSTDGLPNAVQAYRYSANSLETVTTQGFSIGLNHYFGKYYKVGGNYSWNQLVSDVQDPIVPAFNTPEHKYNLSLSGRNMPLGNNVYGFSLNYKWIEGFIFEGSPQFTGFVPSYALLDAQVNYTFKKIDTVLKIGASNLLNNEVFQTYGGPRVGRLAYASLTYEFK